MVVALGFLAMALAGVVFVVPDSTVAALLAPGFPALFGGLIGLAIVIPVARRGWFLPKDTLAPPGAEPRIIPLVCRVARHPGHLARIHVYQPGRQINARHNLYR